MTEAAPPAYIQWIISAGIGLLGILGTINGLLLKDLRSRFMSAEFTLQKKLDKDDCTKLQADCKKTVCKELVRTELELRDVINDKEKEHDELWSVINSHSHTGLPDGSKVTR